MEETVTTPRPTQWHRVESIKPPATSSAAAAGDGGEPVGISDSVTVEASWEGGDAHAALGQMVNPRNLHEQWCGTCSRRLADKSDGAGRPVCGRCAAGVVATVRGPSVPAGRNAPCPCGSGRKFKHCHRRAIA